MTFEEILDQAIAILQRRGRVSYRALQRQFQLNDAYLQDLTVEIVEVLQLAVDQDNTMLVWTGGPSAPAPSVQHAPEAERRQLTVMFCDLVDSTALSRQLDPEDLREVVRAYQHVCSEIITRFDGYIAQLLGDGLLVYFGYPQAHEDDAQRAVRTGLGILDAMGDLNTRLKREKAISLAIRLGIHTGLVVVGAMGGAGHQEQLALGEVPNLAARLQGQAEANTVVISEATYRLVQGYFAWQDLGVQTLRGVAEPLHVYRVLQASGARGRLDVAVTRGLTPLVGRESEVALLRERWEQAKAGQGQAVLLSGDAGIGKSRLVQMLKNHIADERHVRWECRSVPYYQNTALYPLTDLLQRTLQWQPDETPEGKLGKLAQSLSQYRLPLEESVPLFAPLLSLPLPDNRYPPLNLSPQRQRQKTLETIVAILLELAEQQPVLFILEDLHWTDPSTLELPTLVLDQTPTAALLTVLTCRPTFQPSWTHRSYLTEVSITRLAQPQVERMVERIIGGKTLPTEVRQQIIAKTDGVPLFIEEITKAILESGALKEVDGHYELARSLSTFTIPATLQDSLMARLDRLVTAKGVAQLGATIGRQFAYDLLRAVSQLDASTLQRELGRLVQAEIVYQRGIPPQATYTFKHALVQDTAYQSLLRSTRQQYHQRLGQVLAERFPAMAETQPELLAHHYTEAGLIAQAIPYWQRAGEGAIERSAHVEAVGHFTKGLALLKMLPNTSEHTQRELALHIALGAPLMALHGLSAPEVGRVYARARELCQQIRETSELVPVLVGLWRFYLSQGEHQTARTLAEQLLQLVDSVQDPLLLLEAHRPLGQTLFYLGEFAPARTHLAQAIALYDPQQHRSHVFRYGHDAGVACLCHVSEALWCLGASDEALQRGHEALTFARELSHSQSLAFALFFTAMLHQFRREGQAVQERVEAVITLSTEQGFPYWLAVATILQGWELAQQGKKEAGLTQMRQGLSAYQAVGSELWRPYFLALLAEAHGKAGQAEQGLAALAETLAIVERTEECWWEAELHRLKGELLLRRGTPMEEGEACFQQALDVARRQQAKSLELRGAMSLARLWQQQGKRPEAYELLTPIYSWFTEGFDTADLQEAKALLDALA